MTVGVKVLKSVDAGQTELVVEVLEVDVLNNVRVIL